MSLLSRLSRARPVGRLAIGIKGFLPARYRHATAVLLGGQPAIVEIWTFGEFDRLPVIFKPEHVYLIPGMGWLAFREPANKDEIREVLAECERAAEARPGRGEDEDDRP